MPEVQPQPVDPLTGKPLVEEKPKPREFRIDWAAIVFVTSLGLYRFKKSGRIIPQARIDKLVDRVSMVAAENLRTLAKSYRKGTISTAQWVTASTDQIKAAHRAVAMVAAGGRDRMGNREWGHVGGRLRAELDYFNAFANEVEGAELTDGFVTRAASYGQAVYATHSQGLGRRHEKDGTATHEENILDHAASHCVDCPAETDKGRVLIGTLMPIGARQCQAGCRCRVEYSRN